MDSILRASNLIDVEELLEPRPQPPPPPDVPEREVGRGATPADLETVAALAAGDVVSLGAVHSLLRGLANRGPHARFPDGLPVQSSASPFGRFGGEHHAYFVCRGRSDLLNTSQQNATISVAFQSPLNGEVWWDAEDNRRGVVSRPMARRYRSGEAAGRVHGYRGRQFTLIRRGAGGLPTADKTVDVALVQVWRDHEAILGDDGPPPASSFANKGPDTRFSQKRKNEATHMARPHPLAWDRPAHDACFGGPWRRQADVPGDLVVVREVVRFARDVPRGGTVQRAVLPPRAYEAWLDWHRRHVDGAAPGPPPPLPSDSGQFHI